MQTCAIGRAGDLLDRHDVVGVLTASRPAARARPGRSPRGRRTSRAVVGPELGEVVLALLAAAATRACSSSGGNTAAVAPSSAIMLAIVPRSGTRQVGGARPGELEDLVLAAAARVSRRSSSRMMSLAWTQGRSSVPSRCTSDDLRAGDLVGVAGHRHRHVEAAGADRDHAQRAARGGVRVGAHEDAARPREALDVHVVADAVAGARVVDPVAGGTAPAASGGRRGS